MNFYTLLCALVLIAVLFFVVGMVGRMGSGSFAAEITPNVAASLALLVVFAIILLSFSPDDWSDVFGALCGSLPLVSNITDYGSFRNLLHENFGQALITFFNMVLLTAIIDLLSELAGLRIYVARRDWDFFVPILLLSVCIGVISLLVFNFIQSTESYQWIVSAIGTLTSAASLASIPVLIVSIFQRDKKWAAPLVLTLLALSQSKIAAALRSALFKSIIFLGSIYLLEGRFGSLSAAVAQFSFLMVAILPLVILCIGVGFMIFAVFR